MAAPQYPTPRHLSHLGTTQVETAIIAGTITLSGTVTVVVTAAGMTGSPKTFNVAVLLGHTAAQVATLVRAALADDSALTALFAVSGTDVTVVLTYKLLPPAANDATLNISSSNGTTTGVTNRPTSTNTTAGVAGEPYGPIINKFVPSPPVWPGDEVKEMQDGGASISSPNDNPLLRWSLEYNKVSEEGSATLELLDAHYEDAFGIREGFTFRDPRSGVLYNDVHYEMPIEKDHGKVQQQRRSVKLIKRPT